MIKKYISNNLLCNTYYIDDTKKVLVDAGQLVKEKVDIIVLTHCHFDHVYNANSIKKRDNCLIYASKKCAEHLKNLDEVTVQGFFSSSKEPVIVDKILKDKDVIDTGEYSFEVIETPGHTDDSISLYDKRSGVLFSGDTIFDNNMHGTTNFPSGNYLEIKKSIKKLNKLKFKVLYSGHTY